MKSLKFYSLFLLYVRVEDHRADHLLLPRVKLSQKAKISLELVSLPRLLHGLCRKIFLTLCSIN